MVGRLLPGTEVVLTFKITEDMLAGFDGNIIHPVLSTVSLIYYFEKAGRQLILPQLLPDEEGAGYEVCIRHLRPATLGEEVQVKAVAISVSERFVEAKVIGKVGERIIGEGTFTQVLFKKEKFQRLIESLR